MRYLKKVKGWDAMNPNMLKGKLKERALTQEQAADLLGMGLSTFNAKVNGRTEFSLGELQALKRMLALSARQVDQIFFA
jgi:transcriptional regulator with XRE-family HTH domain